MAKSMRKIIVNNLEYRWSVRRTGKYEKSVAVKRGSGFVYFSTDANVTPRMIRKYIEWNPTLEKKDMPKEIGHALYDASIESIVHESKIRFPQCFSKRLA